MVATRNGRAHRPAAGPALHERGGAARRWTAPPPPSGSAGAGTPPARFPSWLTRTSPVRSAGARSSIPYGPGAADCRVRNLPVPSSATRSSTWRVRAGNAVIRDSNAACRRRLSGSHSGSGPAPARCVPLSATGSPSSFSGYPAPRPAALDGPAADPLRQSTKQQQSYADPGSEPVVRAPSPPRPGTCGIAGTTARSGKGSLSAERAVAFCNQPDRAAQAVR
jgi:hypothetical protein